MEGIGRKWKEIIYVRVVIMRVKDGLLVKLKKIIDKE
jgi:hypothetical protein